MPWGNEEWKSYRGTEKQTADSRQNLKFDSEGNSNPVGAFQEKLNATEARGTKDFLDKCTAAFLSAALNFKPVTERCHLKALTAPQDGNSSSPDSLLEEKPLDTRQ